MKVLWSKFELFPYCYKLRNKNVITLVDDVLPLRDALVWEWDVFVVVVSLDAVVVTIVPKGFVIWSAGKDSGTVCSVDLIVVDMFYVKCTQKIFSVCKTDYFSVQFVYIACSSRYPRIFVKRTI